MPSSEEPDRMLYLHGPVARRVELLIYATITVGAILGVIIIVGFIYYTVTKATLNDQVKTNKRAVVKLKAVDKQLHHQDMLLRRLALQGVAVKKGTCELINVYMEANRLSRKYLADVRAGRRQRIGDIKDSEILQGIDRNERVIHSFDNLNCKGGK